MRVDELDYFAFSYLKMSLNGFCQYIESPINKIKGELRVVQASAVSILNVKRDKIVAMQEYRTQKDLAYIYTYNKSWIVLLSNSKDGWASLVWSISKNANIPSYSFRLDKGNDSENCINSFTFHNGIRVDERIVQALIDDGKWRFYKNGPLQEFESPQNYRRRRIKDRINHSILWEYCKRIGIDLAHDSFLYPEMNSVVFERSYQTHDNSF